MFLRFLGGQGGAGAREYFTEHLKFNIYHLGYFTGQNVCLFVFLGEKEELVQENRPLSIDIVLGAAT